MRVAASLAAVVALSAYAGTGAAKVSVSPLSFNPSLGQTVAINVSAAKASRVSVAVIDRDGFLTRLLPSGVAGENGFLTRWDGRDAAGAVVADEAYSFKIDVTSPSGTWSYFPAAQPGKTLPVQAKHYSRRDAAVMYELPKAARVHAQAGTATRDPKSGKYNGPVLKTLVNREPRPAGAIVESWNGFDEGGSLYVPDLRDFATAILAIELPENCVIAYGNRTRTFLDVASVRRGKSLLPAPQAEVSHHQHHRLTALEDVSPSLDISPVNGKWDEQKKAWVIKGGTAQLKLQLKGPTASSVTRQPGKILVFVDYVHALQRAVRHSVETVDVELDEPGRTQVVSINWQSDYGPLAPNSIRITSAVPRKASTK